MITTNMFSAGCNNPYLLVFQRLNNGIDNILALILFIKVKSMPQNDGLRFAGVLDVQMTER